MKRNLLPAFVLATFILAVPLASAGVTFSQDKHIVNAGENFTWNLTFDDDAPEILEVSAPKDIELIRNTTEENKNRISLTFEVGDVEEGPYSVGVRCAFPLYFATYFTSVDVGVASKESLKEVNRSLGQRINGTEAEIRNSLEMHVQALNDEITKLETNYTNLQNRLHNLTSKLDGAENRIDKLESKLQEKEDTTSGITGALLSRGSTLLGLTILIVLVAYLGYEKLKEKEKQGEVEVEEKPKDFSPE